MTAFHLSGPNSFAEIANLKANKLKYTQLLIHVKYTSPIATESKTRTEP